MEVLESFSQPMCNAGFFVVVESGSMVFLNYLWLPLDKFVCK